MGTRVDFYVGRGPQAEWLGSYPYDGYPEGVADVIKRATDEKAFRAAVLDKCSDDRGSLPEHGWPWPWEDGNLTDYSYAFDGGAVYVTNFGRGWLSMAERDEREAAWKAWDALPDAERAKVPEPEVFSDKKTCAWPDMKKGARPTFGPRSGLLILRAPTK